MEDLSQSLQHVSNILNFFFLHSRFDYFNSDNNCSITVFIYVSFFCFLLVQFLSNFLLDITSGKNESRVRRLPVLVECFIDQQKHYFLLLSLVCFAAVYGITTVAATETLNMSYTQHACGLFEIAR